MLQRREQIRPQAPLLFAHTAQIAALQQESKKTLREILGVLGADTLSSHKPVEWPPISPAKLFERLLRRWRFTLRLQHHAPMRSSKCDRSALRTSANFSQWRHLIL